MTDISQQVHAGDLAEYRGTVKLLAGKRCEVIEDSPMRVKVAFSILNITLVRYVKRSNLKRLGGG